MVRLESILRFVESANHILKKNGFKRNLLELRYDAEECSIFYGFIPIWTRFLKDEGEDEKNALEVMDNFISGMENVADELDKVFNLLVIHSEKLTQTLGGSE
jgi:hypothetical protein